MISRIATSILVVVSFLQVKPSAQNASVGTGLEVENHDSVRVVIEDLSKDAADIGLTKERLRTRAELRLRQARFRPDRQAGTEYVYVRVNVVGSAFSVRVEFRRTLSYTVSQVIRQISATTWDHGGVGAHGGSSEYVVQSLDASLDAFLNDYLAANAR